MKQPDTNIPASPQNEALQLQKNAARIGLVTIGASLLLIAYGIYTILGQPTDWVRYLFLGVYVSLGLLGILTYWLSRRGRANLAMNILIATVLIIVIGVGIWLQGQGILLMIIGFSMIATIASLAITARSRVWFIGSGLIVGLFVLFFDMFFSAPWRIQANVSWVSLGVGGLLISLYLATLLFQFRSFSLRNKLVIAFLIVTLVPLSILSYINNTSSREALTDDAKQSLASAARQTATQIDNFIKERTNSIRAESQFAEVVNYLSLSPAKRLGSGEEERLNRFLFARLAQDPVYISSVAIYDVDGNTLLDTYTKDIGINKDTRSWFAEAIGRGLPYASDVEFAQDSGNAYLYFSAPVRDSQGQILGVIRIRYNAAILQDFVTTSRDLVGPGSFAVIIRDNNNMRLAHGSNPALVFKTVTALNPTTAKQQQAKRQIPPGNPQDFTTDLPDFASGLNNADVQPFFTAHLNKNAEELQQVAVINLETLPWRVLYAQAENEFLAPINQQARNSILLAILIALIVAGIAAAVAQVLAGPLVRLTQTAAQIAAGDINILAKVESQDELGQLAATFNRMTQQLREFIFALEERVAARTKDLATVAEVGAATATILETNRLLQEVVDLTKERFKLYHSHIYLLDDTSENLVLAAGAGEVGRAMVAQGRTIPVSREHSLVARAARERQGVIVNDVTQSPDFLPNPLLPDTHAELAVPMIIGNVLFGVFDIQSEQVGRFSESDANIQTTLAAQIATSIQNARLFEESRKQAETQARINTIGQKIQRTTSVEEALQTAIREIGGTIRANRIQLRIGSKTQLEPLAAVIEANQAAAIGVYNQAGLEPPMLSGINEPKSPEVRSQPDLEPPMPPDTNEPQPPTEMGV